MSDDKSVTGAVIGLSISAGLFCIILTPILVWDTYKFYLCAQSGVDYFTKRHPYVVIFSIGARVFYVWLRSVMDFFQIYEMVDPIIVSLIYNTIIQLSYSVIFLRVWLLYYDYSNAVKALRYKWKTLLTKDTKVPWTFKYKWMGKPKILLPALIGYGFLNVTIIMFSHNITLSIFLVNIVYLH